jgi:hypothetical protein
MTPTSTCLLLSVGLPATPSARPCLPEGVLWGNRLVLFVVVFWFGALKVLGLSPAEALVTQLHARTLAAVIPAPDFQLVLGGVECLIGVLWLLPGLTRYALLVFGGRCSPPFCPCCCCRREPSAAPWCWHCRGSTF